MERFDIRLDQNLDTEQQLIASLEAFCQTYPGKSGGQNELLCDLLRTGFSVVRQAMNKASEPSGLDSLLNTLRDSAAMGYVTRRRAETYLLAFSDEISSKAETAETKSRRYEASEQDNDGETIDAPKPSRPDRQRAADTGEDGDWLTRLGGIAGVDDDG